MLRRQWRGELDSWGIRWYLSVFAQDGLVLWPPRSLVANIGFDGSGAHGDALAPKLGGIVRLDEPAENFAFPDRLVADERKVAEIGKLLADPPKSAPPSQSMVMNLRSLARQLCPPIIANMIRRPVPPARPPLTACGTNTDIQGPVEMREGTGHIAVGDNCLIQGHLVAETARSRIVIGNNVFIGGGSTLDCVDQIEIGNDVLISYGCLVLDSDGHSTDFESRRHELPRLRDSGGRNWAAAPTRPVKIGNGAWLGARTIVLKGVEIGEGAVVGAGSVVTRSIPPYMLAGGNPARVIRAIGPDDRR
jgi:acetyltransferase-like isoleucine patch superfamily enzyme